MIGSAHSIHKFSVTIHTDDLAVIYCLRALAKFSQKTGNQQIPWANTKDKDWERDKHSVTFHFSTAIYRVGFLTEVKRLVDQRFWKEVQQRDDDPSHPAS